MVRREALANMESKLKEEEDRAAAAHARARVNEPHGKKEENGGGWQWKGGSAQVEHTRALVQEMKDDILRRHKALMAR